jgi:hypothetical protein
MQLAGKNTIRMILELGLPGEVVTGGLQMPHFMLSDLSRGVLAVTRTFPAKVFLDSKYFRKSIKFKSA